MKNLQAKNEQGWPFMFYIEKATPVEENGQLIVEGVASTVNVDHDHERMADSALHSMSDIINDKGVPLRLEHNKADSAVIGTVYKAWVDERNQLWIRAAMEKGNDTGSMIHEALKQGAKFGLSVGGRVKNAIREMSEATGKMVKTFYDVVLDEVSVTRKPANYDAWLFAKSYKTKEESVEPFLKSSLYKEFLFENQQLDYLRQFAKSIPDKAWSKINKNNIENNMKDENKKDETVKAEEGKKDETTPFAEKSFVTKAEFNNLSAMVTKGFQDLSKAITKAMGDDDAKDTVNPDKDKVIPAEQQTAKAREGQEDDGGNGTEAATGSGETPDKAQDQAQPEKAKPVPAEQQTAKKIKVKSIGDDGKEKETEKAEEDKKDDMEKDEEGDKKDEATKSEDDKKDDMDKAEGDDKDGDLPKDLKGAVKSIGAAINSITSMTKKINDAKKIFKSSEKVEKSQSKLSQIDRFAVTVATALDAMTERFEKGGVRVPGLAQLLADTIKSDSNLQKELAAMVSMPGFKKSVSMGIPYMTTKEGKRYSLSAAPVEEKIQKSEDGSAKTFKSVYQAKFSAFGADGKEQ